MSAGANQARGETAGDRHRGKQGASHEAQLSCRLPWGEIPDRRKPERDKRKVSSSLQRRSTLPPERRSLPGYEHRKEVPVKNTRRRNAPAFRRNNATALPLHARASTDSFGGTEPSDSPTCSTERSEPSIAYHLFPPCTSGHFVILRLKQCSSGWEERPPVPARKEGMVRSIQHFWFGPYMTKKPP